MPQCCDNCWYFDDCSKKTGCCDDCDFFRNGKCNLKRDRYSDWDYPEFEMDI